MNDRQKAPHWPTTGLFPIKIVGGYFYRENIAKIAQNKPGSNALAFCSAFLIPEKDNPHDSNAIMVEIESKNVGHLAKEIAAEFRARLELLGIPDCVTSCDAVISAGIETPETQYNYIIELDLDLSGAPTNAEPTYRSIDRVESKYVLKPQGDGRYLVEIWLEAGVLGNMHKSKNIDTWTTDHWDTVNYYVAHTKNCGIGHKLLSVPKNEHVLVFGNKSPSAKFISIDGRHAVIELVAGV